MIDKNTSKKNALIIEDELIIARVCSRILNLDGYEADIAESGEVAMKMVNGKEYNIYISDIRMPGMSGIEFYNFMKDHYPDRINRMIMITGDLLNSETREFLRDIKAPYLLKPFTPDELREAISKLKQATSTSI